MTVRIGINPLTWTNDDLPSLGANTSLEQCLSEGREAGYSGFELGNKFPRESRELNAVLKKHDLSLISGWFSGNLLTHSVDEEIAAIEEHLQLLKSGGATVMVYCEVTGCVHGSQNIPVSHRPSLQPSEWERFGAKLTRVADYCLNQGVQLAYHHHMGTVVQTAEDIDNLMQNTQSSLGLLLDTGHLTFAGSKPLDVAKKYVDRIIHVHAKDVRKNILEDAKNRDLSFLDAVLNGVFTVPGDGDIDYLPVFQLLESQKYTGWIVVEAEQDPAIAHPLTYAKLGFNNLQNLVKAAGLHIT